MKVTLRARKRQVAGIVRAAMLAGNDMFNVKTETRKLLWQMAILATVSSALTDELACRRVHQAGFV